MLAAARDLKRYLALLRLERRRLHLSLGEALLLCDLAYGRIQTPDHIPFLADELAADPQLPSVAAKWDVDAAQFIRHVRAWTPGQLFAAIDACERFEARIRAGDKRAAREILAEVGLI